MKKGISRWCLPSTLSIDEVIDIVSSAGFDGIEWSLDEHGEISLDSTDAQIDSIKGKVAEKNLEIPSVATGLAWKYPLTSNDSAVVNKAKEIVRKQLAIARSLKANSILVVPGIVNAEVGYDMAYDRTVCNFKELAKYAEDMGVTIGIENVWNKFLVSPREMRMLLDEVGSPYVKAYFDAGNVLQYGIPEDWARCLGNRICKVHIKDFKTNPGGWLGFCNLLEGDMDWKALLHALKENGYDDYLIPEVSGFGHSPEASAKMISMQLDVIIRQGQS